MSVDNSQFSGRTYRLLSPFGRFFLSPEDSSSEDGIRVNLTPEMRGQEQFWQLIDAGDGQCRIRNVSSGKVLDVPVHALAILSDESEASNALWNIDGSEDGVYQILSVNTGEALSGTGARVLFSPVLLSEYRGAPWQQWMFQEVGGA